MKRKKRIFRTAKERAAWEARGEEVQRELRYWIDRGKAELEAKKKPA